MANAEIFRMPNDNRFRMGGHIDTAGPVVCGVNNFFSGDFSQG
jgi:hypothetical protein